MHSVNYTDSGSNFHSQSQSLKQRSLFQMSKSFPKSVNWFRGQMQRIVFYAFQMNERTDNCHIPLGLRFKHSNRKACANDRFGLFVIGDFVRRIYMKVIVCNLFIELIANAIAHEMLQLWINKAHEIEIIICDFCIKCSTLQ